MRRRKQIDETGCGLACISILSGKSYAEVRRVAYEKLGFELDGDLYTSTGQLKVLAEHFRIKLDGKRRRKFIDWASLPDVAIVSINPTKDNKYWHWVVFERKNGKEAVLDPKQTIKSNRRTDFGRMNPCGYLPVIIMVT